MKILQPWRTKESPTARRQQQHLHKQRQMKRSVPTSRWARGNCHDTEFADENYPSPYCHYNSNVRNHLYGVDENLDSIMLTGFGSLLTKILFSYRSTEVYGILIVMKIPTERSRSWGLRSNPWLLIGEVREACICLHSHFGSMHFGALRWLHSTHPYGKIEYDFRFDMIDVVPFEMIYDEFRVVVAWPTTTAAESGTTRFEMTDDCLFDMIYDYPFDRATVSLRPEVIKKLLPGEAKKVAYVKAHWTICKALKYKTRLNQL